MSLERKVFWHYYNNGLGFILICYSVVYVFVNNFGYEKYFGLAYLIIGMIAVNLFTLDEKFIFINSQYPVLKIWKLKLKRRFKKLWMI